MRFTRLRLNGFKSFVDPTDLVIAPGLTGVVGPNGCGKSNLLEALRWVMGENRPTAMRGEGMEDVIFAGAASRPARSFAEVVLTIDNEERLAPAEFNDADRLDIVRRITRDAGSAYKANGRDIRARDVQMLFADASTGAHSPALVRQGQISELISARPVARRRILEEAAGISGLYQRRHEVELKLNATAANLTRVDDVLEQLASQIAVLARQSRQAARYREIGEALRLAEGLLLYARWRDAGLARDAAEAERAAAARTAAAADAAAGAAARERERHETALPPVREEAAIAAAVVERLDVQQGQLAEEEARAAAAIRAAEARTAQLARDSEREAQLNRDAGETIARLDWEDAQVARAQEGHEDRLDAASRAARAAAAELQAREGEQGRATEDLAALSARHQSAQRLIADSRATLARNDSETAKAAQAAQAAAAARARAGEDFARAERMLTEATGAAEAAEAALTAAEAARAAAQGDEAEARAARASAEGEANALGAEAAALARLVERETKAGGQILDRIEVEPGYEKALGAALADDLRAPEIAGGARSGWAALAQYETPAPLPAGAAPLAPHVRAPEVLARRMSQIGLVAGADGAAMQAALRPGQRLVSLEGDLWRWDGLRAAAADAPSAAALRLQQVNRLAALRRDLEGARARAEAAAAAHGALAEALAARTRADQTAREARREADRRLAEASRALSRAEADRSLAEGRLETSQEAERRHAAEAGAAREQAAQAEAALADLPDLDAARAGVEEMRAAAAAARQAMIARRGVQDEIRREGEARARRRQEIAGELATWQGRLAHAETRGAELAQRRDEAEAELAEARRVPGELAARRAELAASVEAATLRRLAADAALATAEGALRAAQDDERGAERGASETREARARAEARADAAREALIQEASRIREELEIEPSVLATRLDGVETPAAAVSEAEIARLRRARDGLGAVNLRAEEDAREKQEEHDTLAREKADLEEAVRKLRGGISALNREGRERLLTAFEQVNASFAELFTHLFGGGEAKLILVESDDPLEAGLEIMCQPPGKKLSTLSLLSGGEQTLTALALIFAVFLANPAPICVLDEVDAPLDDANVTRFCDLLDEMTRRTGTRFLVITHHAVTMSRMHRLFGVTMQEQGVSQLVSVDLARAEALVA